jgi:hypothetical protein
MNGESVLTALRAHDRNILARPPIDSPSQAADIERALPQLDEEARVLAANYLVKYDKPGTGNLLLKLAADPSAQVSIASARGLTTVKDTPPGSAILALIPTRQDRYVRARLYLAAGRASQAPGLEALRAVSKQEMDPDAALDAQVAAVRLGGEPERKAFLERIKAATPDTAIKIRDQLFYVGDPKLAKGLIPWLANKEGVLRLGGDHGGRMLRMCDLAVWISHQLGVKVPMPDVVTTFDEGVLAGTKAMLQSLPD